MKYRAEIDGLRALALIPVILFHAGFKLFSGGFVGVDVFFVISGYLITTIIVSEMDRGEFSLARFYERRARRILPALFFVILCTLPFAWFWMIPREFKEYFKTLVAVSLFVSNLHFSTMGSYFGSNVENNPLLHTWSLAVEEQYYFLFPLFLIITWKLCKKWIVLLLILLGFFSLYIAQRGTMADQSFSFYMLSTRAFEILIGALISFFLNGKELSKTSSNLLVSQFLSLFGLILVCLSVFTFNKDTPSPSLYTLVPTVGAGLVILFANKKNLVGNLLGSKIFVGVGLVSYSAYLWHQPLLAFARIRSIYDLSVYQKIFLSITSICFGYLSWKFVERPFRESKIKKRKIITLALSINLFFIIFGSFGIIRMGFQSRLGILDHKDPVDSNATIAYGWCFYSIDTLPFLKLYQNGLNCSLGSRDKDQVKGVLFGDSFAGMYEPFWDYIGKLSNLNIHSVTTNWCYPSLEDSFTGPKSSRAYKQCLFNRKYFKENYQKYDFVILGGMWSAVLNNQLFKNTFDLLDEISANSKLIIVMPEPKQFDENVQAKFQRSYLLKFKFDIKDTSFQRDKNALFAQSLLLSKINKKNIIFLGREDVFGLGEFSDDGIPYSADGSHISIYTSKLVASKFVKTKTFKNLIQKINNSKK